MAQVLEFPFAGIASETQFNALPKREKTAIAAAYFADVLHVKEEGGNNKGFWVARFLHAVGLNPGFAWCAAFVSFVLALAGVVGGPKYGRAAVRNWEKWARENNRLFPMKRAVRGDLVGYADPKTGLGHIAICIGPGLEPLILLTIEGNTNKKGSREGDGVYRKERRIFENWWCIKL
jgi:hypothetical protein